MTKTLLLLGALAAAAPAHGAVCTFDGARERFETLLAQAQLPGGAMLIGNRDGLLYERYFGVYDRDTTVPIASATKLLSAVRIVPLPARRR